ncbi:hypothetical protein ACTFIU_007177 [Dictyostelium citrinum]
MNKELIDFNNQIEFKTLRELQEYPYKEFIRILVYSGSEHLTKNDLPKNENRILKVIKLTDISQSNINVSIIPEGVEELHYPFENESVTTNLNNGGSLPNSIKSIYNFNINNNESSKVYFIDTTTIPNHIETLSFRCYSNFNEKINGETFKLPSTITSLTLGDDWKNGGHPLKKGDFHEGLRYLDIIGYDKPLTVGVLPQSLESLSIGHPNNYALPSLLKSDASSDIQSFLPIHLKKLSISSQFNKGLSVPTNSIPQSITSLKLMSTDIEIDKLLYTNSTIKNLEIYISLKEPKQIITKEMLPSNLESLTVSTQSNIIEKNALPKTLQSLNYSIQDDLNSNLTNIYELLNNGFLNQGLKKLTINLPNISSIDNINFNGIFPNSLKELTFENNFNINLSQLNKNGNVFNEGLEILKFGYKFNGNIEIGLLPSTLKQLELGGSFNNQIASGCLPNGLKILKFDEWGNFNQPLEFNVFPSKLEQLFLPKGYNQSITSPGILPLSLKVLQIPKKLKTDNLINDSSIPSSILIIKFN